MSRNATPAAVQVVTAENMLSRFLQHIADGVYDEHEQQELKEAVIELTKMSWLRLVDERTVVQTLNLGADEVPDRWLAQLQQKALNRIEELDKLEAEPIKGLAYTNQPVYQERSAA